MSMELDDTRNLLQKFAGTWEVIKGNAGRVGSYAILERVRGRTFELSSKDGSYRQTLVYNPVTRTLDSQPGDLPERCISLWDRHPYGSPKNCIFALRRAVALPKGSKAEECLLPWEMDDLGENLLDSGGAWGAEEGG